MAGAVVFRPSVEDYQVALDEFGTPYVIDPDGLKSDLDNTIAGIDELMSEADPFGIFCFSELKKYLLLSAHRAKVKLN